eukprot:6213799-Pleurochrysis_carterae.AAC.2
MLTLDWVVRILILAAYNLKAADWRMYDIIIYSTMILVAARAGRGSGHLNIAWPVLRTVTVTSVLL